VTGEAVNRTGREISLAAGVPRRYWLTTHWPPLETEDVSLGVYICNGRQEAGRDLQVGDMVLIYEAGSCPDVLRRKADGSPPEWLKHRSGRKGIVAIIQLSEALLLKGDEPETLYRDGSKRLWCWQAQGRMVNVSGFVPSRRAAEVMGKGTGFHFRAIGKRQSGLLEITEATYRALVDEFKSNRPREKAPPAKRRVFRPSPEHGEGGEGAIHKALKEAVYSDPSKVLGISDLKSIHMEYPFTTGDRADVVLEDFEGRYIAVEVEPAVTIDDLTGVLQAVKYRYMFAVDCRRDNDEVRAFLVAHHIDQDVVEICRRYGVECFPIPRPPE